jgi:hypothetical protein
MTRSEEMNLNTVTFGIAGGFSALRPVTDRFFPSHYPLLLGKIPSPDYIAASAILPIQWESIKNRVVLPYLEAAINTKNETSGAKIEDLFDEWNKRYF